MRPRHGVDRHETPERFYRENHFARGNREFGRVLKTEHILAFMSDQGLRKRTHKGLLKTEQMHGLARELNYGKQGKLNAGDMQEQQNSCSCLTLIMACIIYWQSKEIGRVVMECEPEKHGIDISLLEHISPIMWENVILYGDYLIDLLLIRP